MKYTVLLIEDDGSTPNTVVPTASVDTLQEAVDYVKRYSDKDRFFLSILDNNTGRIVPRATW